MGKIYKGQTAVTVQLTVGRDITDATALIKYRKPGGTTGSWSAEITDAEKGIIRYRVAGPDDLDEAGVWVFWADITFSTGKHAEGEPFTRRIYDPGY